MTNKLSRVSIWALHVLIAVPLILLFSKVFTHGYVLEGMIDRHEITLPFHYLNLRAFHAGEYPQWCAALFSGVPIPHIAMDYAWNPLNWPLYFFGKEEDIPTYITYFQILKHVLTGVSAYLFFRKVLTSLGGIALATCIYTWSASAVWITITTELTIGLFLPLGFLFLLESKNSFSPRLIALFAIIFAIDVSGGVLQWTYFLWLVWFSYAVYLSFGAKKIQIFRVGVPAPLCLLMSASALAALLSAPKLMPFIGALLSGEITRGSDTATLWQSVNAFHTPLIAFIRIISPNILGYLTPKSLLFAPGPHQNYVETMLAGVGFVAVATSLYGIIFGRTYRQCLYPFLMIGLLLSIILFKPISYLWMLLPGKGMIYSRWAVYLPIFLAWSAGMGVEWLATERTHPRQSRVFWLILVGCIVLVVGLILPHALAADRSYYFANFLRSALLLGATMVVLCLIVMLRQKRFLPTRILQSAIVLACLAELSSSAATEVYTYYKFLVPGKSYYATDPALQKVLEDYGKRRDFTVAKYLTPVSYNPFPTANSNIVYHLPQVSGFTNTLPKSYVESVAAMAGTPPLFRHIDLPEKLYEAFGVAYAKIGGTNERYETVRSHVGVPNRAKLARTVEVVESEGDVLSRLRNLPDPAKTVVLDKKEAARLSEDEGKILDALMDEKASPSINVGHVTWLENGVNSFQINVETTSACFLNIFCGYYKGIHGFVDGKKTTVLRVNHAFMAVAIPPGKHTVMMRYQNPFLPWAFFCALVGGILCVAILFWKRTSIGLGTRST